jgi:hypothetical protein
MGTVAQWRAMARAHRKGTTMTPAKRTINNLMQLVARAYANAEKLADADEDQRVAEGRRVTARAIKEEMRLGLATGWQQGKFDEMCDGYYDGSMTWTDHEIEAMEKQDAQIEAAERAHPIG